MEVHSSESKSSATAAASVTGVAGNQKENGNSHVGAGVTAANSTVDDSKVEIVGNVNQSAKSTFIPFPSTDSNLLLEDATLEKLPNYCENVFADVDITTSGQFDLLIVLVYCVALESSFALSDVLAKTELEPVYWGSTFHKKNVDRLAKFPRMVRGNNENYVLNLSFYSRSAVKEVKLVGIPTGDSFVVTITPDDLAPGYSICLPVSRYVLSSTRSQNVAARFRNLKELALELKERIFVPVKIHLAESDQNTVFIGLAGMPEEIVYLILRKLKLKFIQNLSKTCRKMRVLCENYRAVAVHFPNEVVQPEVLSPRTSSSSFHIRFIDVDY